MIKSAKEAREIINSKSSPVGDQLLSEGYLAALEGNEVKELILLGNRLAAFIIGDPIGNELESGIIKDWQDFVRRLKP